MSHPIPPAEQIEALAGHRFPGGEYRIEHWENVLLTGCTGAELLPDGLVHPVALFHVPIAASGTSIAEMFALGQADSDSSIGIESYDWIFHKSLREEIEYRVEAEITEAGRRQQDDRTYDRIQFRFDLFDNTGEPAATTVVTWHYNRRAV